MRTQSLNLITSLPLFVTLTVLWLLGLHVSIRRPITAAQIVTALLFVLLLLWFLYAVVGLMR